MDSALRQSEKKPLVSLVVPVYKVEPYLDKALQSIEKQDFKDFEVIIVNDGSPDNCQQIIDRFVHKNPYFTCILQENKGLGEARNTGIRRAKGKYIMFMDSDDFIASNFISRMYETITSADADIACCECTYFFSPSGTKYNLPFGHNTVLSREDALKRLMRDISVHHFAWNKIYKLSLFIENQIFYPSILFEDIATTSRLFLHCKKIAFIREHLYFYVQRSGSIMSNINYRRQQDLINALAIIHSYYDNANSTRDFQRQLDTARRITTWNISRDIITMHLRTKKLAGTGTDIKNAWRQLRNFKEEALPVLGEPWEEIVVHTVYHDAPSPQLAERKKTRRYKPYISFYSKIGK